MRMWWNGRHAGLHRASGSNPVDCRGLPVADRVFLAWPRESVYT